MNPIMSRFDEIVNSRGGAKIVAITTHTPVKLLKRGRKSGDLCPVGSLFKLTDREVIIACNYENCVNRQLEREGKEGDFKASVLWGGKGKHVEGSACLIHHVEKPGIVYIAAKLIKDLGEMYLDGNGKPVDKKRMEDWLPKEGTESIIEWRVIKVDNITAIRYQGNETVKPITLPTTQPVSIPQTQPEKVELETQ